MQVVFGAPASRRCLQVWEVNRADLGAPETKKYFDEVTRFFDTHLSRYRHH
jgi:hypothetical protein